jgi:hypothetical protein
MGDEMRRFAVSSFNIGPEYNGESRIRLPPTILALLVESRLIAVEGMHICISFVNLDFADISIDNWIGFLKQIKLRMPANNRAVRASHSLQRILTLRIPGALFHELSTAQQRICSPGSPQGRNDHDRGGLRVRAHGVHASSIECR